MNAINLLAELTEIYNSIASPNLPYSDSMDGSLLPSLVLLTLDDKEFNEEVPNHLSRNYTTKTYEEMVLDNCRFLARNERVLPSSLGEADWKTLRDYAREHRDEILSDVKEIADSTCEQYGEPVAYDLDECLAGLPF